MRNFTNALACILFGLLVALISCSAVKMANKNIQIQKQDTVSPLPDRVPNVPAIITPIKHYNGVSRMSIFKPFKDTLIMMHAAIQKVNLDNSRKMDTLLRNQYKVLDNQNAFNYDVQALKSQVQGLKLDTAKLYNKLSNNYKTSKEVKTDAIIGTTVISFIINLLIFIAVGVVLIFAIVLYLAQKERNRRKTKLA